MKRQIVLCLASLCFAAVAMSCGIVKKAPAAPVTYPPIALELNELPQRDKYINMDYGIRLNVNDGRSSKTVVYNNPSRTTTPEVFQFVSESLRRYMRTMGFNLDADVETDYLMDVVIEQFNVRPLGGTMSSVVQLAVKVYDSKRALVYPHVVAVGRATASTEQTSLNVAYANALKDIDWDRIAFFLKRAANPAQEKNKKVTGEGNTALEATVIRWYIDSTPKGADVSWRVVSSTPEVKNTNSNYVGSTPYETTETFDIKGLTFNNSGNVQIEVVCERAGYVTQKKRFNVRQAIEQKEISTKFNMVKEAE